MMCDPAGAAFRIACLGDSLTRGDGSHERRQHASLLGRGNYPAELQTLLGKAAFEVRNFGHGGTTACNSSESPYTRTPEWRRALRYRPHLVVLMLGTNDAKDRFWGRQCADGAADLAAGLSHILAAMASAALGAGSPPPATLVIEPPPLIRERWGIRRHLLVDARRAVRSFAASAAATATSQLNKSGLCTPGSVWFAPSFRASSAHATAVEANTVAKFFTADGVHLNVAGSQRLACAVYSALVEHDTDRGGRPCTLRGRHPHRDKCGLQLAAAKQRHAHRHCKLPIRGVSNSKF
jgi:lysophospholipase L1-like esterase